MVTTRKTKTAFFCTGCGAEHAKWQGQCRECQQWNTLVEERIAARPGSAKTTSAFVPQMLPEIDLDIAAGIRTNLDEFDRVLGGQVLPGMTVLLGGEPGIGKSTLLLQVGEALSRQGLPLAYVSGEESSSQLKQRARRLGITGDNIAVLNTSMLDDAVALLEKNYLAAVIIDSIQTLTSPLLDSPPGSVGQVRECAAQLIRLAREKSLALFLVGHVTKEGLVAGPKVLEHMVDTVVYFEGDPAHLYRILRAVKNRFGSINEIGLFEMQPQGLVPVANPSSLFLSGHTAEPRSGSVVTAVCEGNRAILVEVQALVTPANYGTPQRVAGGIDARRLALLLAVLEKRCGYAMGTHDVFVSIAGGLNVSEPAIDLPVLVAIASSLLDRSVTGKSVIVGETGLAGEVRGISMADRRLAEARRMGFEHMILPAANAARTSEAAIEVFGVSSLSDTLDIALG